MKPIQTLTVSLLNIFGFRDIHTAATAEEGFNKLCAFNPDIVMTEWMLEPYDGISLTHKIRTDPSSPNPFVPIIMVTGYSARPRVIEARDKGITEFLVKPFNANDLLSRIEHLLEKPRQFVDSKEFFGPDRRRRKSDDYEGPRRRARDEKNTGDRIEDILAQLQAEANRKRTP